MKTFLRQESSSFLRVQSYDVNISFQSLVLNMNIYNVTPNNKKS